MKLKKLTSLALSGAVALSSAIYVPAHASEVSDSYFKDIKSVSTWEKTKSESNSNVGVAIKSGKDSMSFGYKIDVKSNSDNKNLLADFSIVFTPNSNMTPSIPAIHMYIDGTSLYINKDAFNAIAPHLGIEKKAEKDYILLKIDKKDLEKSGLTLEMLKKSANSTEMLDKLVKFVQKIDLGIDLAFTKKDGSYMMSWDADKIVDVTNAYIRYILKNPTVMFDFYKEVLGIDLDEMYKDAGMSITKDDMLKNSKEVLDMWNKSVVPELAKIKQILKGSKITIKETFKENEYNQDFDMMITVDLAKATKLFSSKGNDLSAMTKGIEKVELSMSSKGKATNAPELVVTVPKDSDEFDVSAYAKEQQAKQEAMLKEMQKIKVVANSKSKQLTITAMGETKTVKADMKMVKGLLYVSTKDLNDNVFFDTLETKEKYVPFKETMQKQGYSVSWDQKSKSSIAESK